MKRFVPLLAAVGALALAVDRARGSLQGDGPCSIGKVS